MSHPGMVEMAVGAAHPNADKLSWRNAKLIMFLTLQTISESNGSHYHKGFHKPVPHSSSLIQTW